jgi:hypothetical protein
VFDLIYDYEYWRRRAEMLRTMASGIADTRQRDAMRSIAANYETIAGNAEARALRLARRGHRRRELFVARVA